MKKFINAPDDVVREALAGVAAAHSGLRVDFENQIVVRADAPRSGKVGLLSGGGSGHEPLHGGFVGAGMLDAAAPGEVFTSPVPDQILAATKAVDGGAGVVHIVKNYTGDVMNFQMAAELAADDGVTVETVRERLPGGGEQARRRVRRVGAEADRRPGPVGVQLVGQGAARVRVHVDDDRPPGRRQPSVHCGRHRGRVRAVVRGEQVLDVDRIGVAKALTVRRAGVHRSHARREQLLALVGEPFRVDDQPRQEIDESVWFDSRRGRRPGGDDVGVRVGEQGRLARQRGVGEPDAPARVRGEPRRRVRDVQDHRRLGPARRQAVPAGNPSGMAHARPRLRLRPT